MADERMDRQEARLRELLEDLAPQEIIEFREQLHAFATRAFHWDLWAVADIAAQLVAPLYSFTCDHRELQALVPA